MHVDHVCVAVKSIEDARDRLCGLLGYRPRTEIVTNSRQKVRVTFLQRDGSLDIKLIEPSGEDSPLWSFLRSKGEGLHHLCFRTGNVRTELGALAARGLRVLQPPQPGEAFDDELIAFGYAGFGLNIELIESDRRRAAITPEADQTG